jgi:hypothetical protein
MVVLGYLLGRREAVSPHLHSFPEQRVGGRSREMPRLPPLPSLGLNPKAGGGNPKTFISGKGRGS